MQINTNSFHLGTKQFPSITPSPTIRSSPRSRPVAYKPPVLEDSVSPMLSLQLSPSTLLFDPLTPTNPLLRDTIVSFAGMPASMLLFDNTTLQSDRKDTIEDTTCDNGDCTTATPDTWQSSLTYGFGYTCKDLLGDTCSLFFSHDNSYAQIGQNIYYATQIASTTTMQTRFDMIYKINIAASQAPGNYNNAIIYLLMPSL